MPAPQAILDLVQRFQDNLPAYKSHKYNEATLSMEFLNPFFEALGWDIYNKNNYAEAYKDVVIETSVEVEGAAKAPDYAFRIGGTQKFFVEAKKPSVNIEHDTHPAFQVRRYAWSAGLPLSILTDFEEFAVYDCRSKPSKSDQAASGRVMLVKFTEYAEKWDEIAAKFSRDAVLKGGYDQFAGGVKGKRGTQEVDDAFLLEIESWREKLARNLALRNPSLSVPELNYAVQMTIDRIIFLRICEDRGIERENQLKEAVEAPNAYAALTRLFQQADARYNSGLFHFAKEKEQCSQPDDLTLGLKIDDGVLKEIIAGLYYPAPYVFREIPTAILGSVYERFLGKVIRLTAGHQARVEEKPEVRKAGGVYYTPAYIVDYIVKNTVGKLLEGKTPAEAAKLKIVDPACGSGSFLLGAYQCLLDWHSTYYAENEPEKWAKGAKPAIYQGLGGGWRLTTSEKKRILLNNLHGVDIDPQAVEVTKLSLSLKVLEGENQESIGAQLSFPKERALPDLGRNIQCGNSLIGADYFEGRLFPDEEELRRVNPFDWLAAYPQVFAQGGFDAVIGNPPYVRMEEFKEIKEYLRKNYKCHCDRADMYAYMVERGHKIIKPSGLLGMIVSNKFLKANYGKSLRDFISHNANIDRIIDFAGLPVFKGATVRTIILLDSNENQKATFLYAPPLIFEDFSKVESGAISLDEAIEEESYEVPNSVLEKPVWAFENNVIQNIITHLEIGCTPLFNYCHGLICMGIKSGLSEAFVIDQITREKLICETPEAEEIIKPFINGRDIRRYALESKNNYLIYTFHGVKIENYPSIEKHLLQFKEKLLKRATKQKWYELQQPQYGYQKYFDSSKIVFPDISITPRFVLDENGFYGSNTMYFIPLEDDFLLGLLNSKPAYFYFRTICAGLEGKNEIYLRFFGQYLEKFPIPMATNDKKARMSNLVKQMLKLKKQAPLTPQEKRHCSAKSSPPTNRLTGWCVSFTG